MRKIITILVIIALNAELYCQTSDSTYFEELPASLFEVIKQLNSDTFIFYYNDRWQLVKPGCSAIFRISGVDTVLNTFSGKFIDYFSDSTIAVEGNYSSGKKEGLFNIYFPNGQLEQSGYYVDNQKNGIWEYFYENGRKRQILDFRDNEILVLEFWNEDGKNKVDSGTGNWSGFETPEKFVKISGKVLNGKKNGTWKKSVPSQHLIINTEKYKEGKFVSGTSYSILGSTELYLDSQYCIVEQPPSFLTAELFQINRCFKLQKNNWEFAKYQGGMDGFFGEIEKRFVLSENNMTRGIIRVQFTIDETGKMTNFKPVSDIGLEYELIRVLHTMSNWIPTKINGKPTIQIKIIDYEIW